MQYDPQKSLLLDAVIILLDKHPPSWVRLVLSLYKRQLERGVR
jgi:hypothetical protein